jgi:hypothetical protein
VYADCTAGVPRGNPLRTDRVQNIIVRDVTAPYFSDVLETDIAQGPTAAAMVTYAIKDKIDLDKMTDTEMAAFHTDLVDQIIALFPGLEAANIATIVLQGANARRSRRAAAAAEVIITFTVGLDQTLVTSVLAAIDAAITAGTFKETATVANVPEVVVFTNGVPGMVSDVLKNTQRVP